LLSRTTRSVSTTEAGETLLRSLRPALEEITTGVNAVAALRGKPSGTVRITATKHAVSSVVMPVLPRFLASHPDIRVDLIIDDNLTDIVAERIDAGIRFGDIVQKDNDRSPDRAGHPDGRRRRSVVFRRSPAA